MKFTLKYGPLSLLTRYGLGVSSGIFLLCILLLNHPTLLTETSVIQVSIFLSIVYCATSLLSVNFTYRYKLLCENIIQNKIEEKIYFIRKKLDEKFPDKESDIDLLIYYFSEGVEMFINSDFEAAFMAGYKCIREETVVNPTEYVSDKRGEEVYSFSDIRAILTHSRRKKFNITVKEINKVRSDIPIYALEVLMRALDFLNKLVVD